MNVKAINRCKEWYTKHYDNLQRTPNFNLFKQFFKFIFICGLWWDMATCKMGQKDP